MTKISDFPAVTDFLDTDEFILARSGATKKMPGSMLSGWKLDLSLDGTSVVGLTQQAGTWTSSAGEILVSPGGGVKARAYPTASIRSGVCVFEVKVKMLSTGSHAGSNHIGMLVAWDGTGGSGGGLFALACSGLTPSSNGGHYTENTQGTTVGPSDSVRFNLDTTYTLRAFVSGQAVEYYRDGTALWTTPIFAASTGGVALHCGLYALNCDASFDDVRIWVPTLP